MTAKKTIEDLEIEIMTAQLEAAKTIAEALAKVVEVAGENVLSNRLGTNLGNTTQRVVSAVTGHLNEINGVIDQTNFQLNPPKLPGE